MKSYKRSLFIFRRDLRLQDNLGLIRAAKESEEVMACFIFTPAQLEKNPYRSEAAVQFMIESLKDLEKEIEKKDGKFYYFEGSPSDVVSRVIKEANVDAIFMNRDYTPFAVKRDEEIRKVTEKMHVACHIEDDALLTKPEEVKTRSGEAYKVFSPFLRAAKQISVLKPNQLTSINFAKPRIVSVKLSTIKYESNKNVVAKGGRTEARKILKKIAQFKKYKTERDLPAVDGTTKLSAHHKFGTISIRESYWVIRRELGTASQLISELYWRDFFTHVAFHFPYVFKGAFREDYNEISWSESEKNFNAWCEGKTGFPIVDAGMRQLRETGWMHNRVRMITASFLVKDLHINWQQGEKFFAQNLVDYDPAVNNGNWQWVAGTGCDAAPYFRIFNPWTQQKKFDGNAEYIKRFIPELKDLSAKQIHDWEKKRVEGVDYPAPIIDHAEARKETLKMYKRV